MPSRGISEEIAHLQAERERLRLHHAAGASGHQVVRAMSDAVDQAIVALWERIGAGRRAALVAVGGYGRRQMNPASDVDLMVLHAGGKSGVPDASKALFYELWDAGLEVGHSIRTPKEALKIAKADFDAETAFLDARLVTGDPAMFDDFHQDAMRQTASNPRAFLNRLRDATRERIVRGGDATSELEPNVKEGRGALRDVHALGWIRTVTGEEPRVERRVLDDAEELLLRIRNELHFLTGRHADVLLMQLQGQVAAAVLGGEGNEDALMRTLYERCRAVAYALDAMLDGKVVSAPELQETWTPQARRDFFALLRRGESGRAAFRELEHSGVLVRALPEWEHIRCLPQRNVYHRFPVDVHAFESVAALASLRTSSDELTRAVAEDAVDEWDALLLAALLHDIGKGSEEDHSIRGEKLARAAVGRIGLPEPAALDVPWLVRHHLLMSDTATRRDIDDESLIIEMAETIGSARRLRMLYLVSVADGLATGPTAWSPWKSGLVQDLFAKVAHVLEQGDLVSRDATELAQMRTAELREGLSRFPADQVQRQIASMPRAWLLSQPASALIRQSALMLEPMSDEPVKVHATPSGDPGIWEVIVVSTDRPGLTSKISGVLALNGINVLAAQIFTRDDGIALEVFRVEAPDEEKRRFDRVREDAAKVLRGKLSLDVRLARKRADYAGRVERGKREEPRVVVDNRSSDFYTLVEVHATDRVGLLYTVTRAMADLELNIHLAKVATYAEDVVDTFYVRDLEGQKVTDPEHVGEIETTILHVLSNE